MKMQKTTKRLIPSLPPGIFIGITVSVLIAISRFVDGHPMESLMDNDRSTESSELEDALVKNDEVDYRREEILENIQKMFGIRVQSANKSVRHITPPQFMMELYNTIADPSGVTRGKNPYNAKIVRSFVERDNWLSQLYLFNISGLEINESVIEAELHLYRKRSALKVIHPTILRSPYYLIRVYQVLEGQNMDEPDLHRLLNVHYVGAHASGWQVFNVKQAVLAWIAGAPNLGLMVTASTLFGDEASIEFTRRNDYHHSKQPILVLFDDDGRANEESSENIQSVPHYYTYNDDDKDDDLAEDDTINNDRSSIEEDEENNDSEPLNDDHSGSNVFRQKRQQDDYAVEELKKTAAIHENKELNKELDYGTQLGNNLENDQTEFLQRFKRIGRKQSLRSHQDLSKTPSHSFKRQIYFADGNRKVDINGNVINQPESFHRQTRSAIPEQQTVQPHGNLNFVSRKKTRLQQVLSSLDIYERSLLRQRIKKESKKFATEKDKRKEEELAREEAVNSYKWKQLKRFPREAGEESEEYVYSREDDTMECTRNKLYVDFNDVGLASSIIAPKGYSAFQCQGRCDGLLTRDQQSTNHATVQGIIHRMGLMRDVTMPCCVPTKLLSISILFIDDYENVVLKVFDDMIADRCGCR